MLCAVFAAFGTVFADDSEPLTHPTVYEPQALKRFPEYVVLDEENPYGSSSTFGTIAPASNTDLMFSLEEMIKEALLNNETKVDLASYHINKDTLTMFTVFYFSPYLNGDINVVVYTYSDQTYAYLDLSNAMTVEETRAYFDEVDKEIEKVRAIMAYGESELEKALILHDYLAYTAEYDHYNYLANTIPEISYRAGGVLMNKIGVCQSYAYAYMYLLTLEGIECHVTTSDEMNHAWNIVKIDGQCYQVDITWDDPVYDLTGRVCHTYFLVSDKVFEFGRAGNYSMNSHYGWNENSPKCTSTTYDYAFWVNIGTNINFYGDYLYFATDRGIIKRSMSTGKETTIADPGKWYVWNSNRSYWPGKYTGVTVVNGELYYNSPTEIRKINLSTGTDTLVYQPDCTNGYIYGSVVVGDEIIYEITKSPNDDGIAYTYTIEAPKVAIDKKEISLEVGESFLLMPLNITQGLTWSSDDPSVASVDSIGLVTAHSTGSTIIRVSAENGSSAYCVVNVIHIHDYNEVIVTPPTCEVSGIMERTCKNCSYTETVILHAIGHDSYYHRAKEPTCYSVGWKAYFACRRCDYTTYTELPVTSHTPKTVNGVSPTCTESGKTSSQVCDVCDKILVPADTVPATGHNFGDWITVTPATEETEGAKKRSCAICGHEEFGVIPTLQHSHSYEAEIFAATCTAGGYTTHTCRCGDTYKDSETSPLGHDTSKVTINKESTCTSYGEEQHSCVRCEYYELTVLPLAGHTEATDPKVDPTCTTNGHTEGIFCMVCRVVIVPTSVIDPLGHDLSDYVTVNEPTCTIDGVKKASCSRCIYSETKVITATGHVEEALPSVDATCTETGLSGGSKCSVCGTLLDIHNVVPALGHDFEADWTVDFEATTEAEGQKSRHCTRCDEVTDIIAIAKQVKIIDSAEKFTDLEVKSWSKEGIDYVVSYGYMNGTGNGTTFSQTGTMTRAMIVSVLYRMAGSPATEAQNPFVDLEAGQTWYHAAVIWAYENGIVTGTSSTTFAPNGAVTREQMATFLFRYASHMGYDTTAAADLSVFPDEASVGTWAKDSLSWANANGLITGAVGNDGVTRLNPQGAATREQVATILMRFCKSIEK